MHRPRPYPRTPLPLLLLPLALLLASCMDHPLPTALAPEGAALSLVSGDYVVTNTNNSGEGSLREAITLANAAGEARTITFNIPGCDIGPCTITLASGLAINSAAEITIDGTGQNVTVSGNNSYRVMYVWTTATLKNLTIANGRSGDGGGGIRNPGTLTVTNSTFSGNSAATGGGGINNTGTLTITNSTFSGNSADYTGGGIYNAGTLTVTNSTISGNSTTEAGGGILNVGTLTITNSLVAGNTAPFGPDILGSGAAASYSLIGSTAGNDITATPENGNLVNVAPLLGPLADNGGPTRTHALLPGSPAIDHIPVGTSGCGTTITTDQRGVTRPQGSGCDIGAFELEQAQTPPPSEPLFGGFQRPVREDALNVMNAGRAVPVNFSLGGDFGLQIFQAGYPTSVPIPCPAADAARHSLSATSTGVRESRLNYDAGAEQYTYLWVTERAWAGSCRQLQLRFDGIDALYTLDFEFR